MCSKCLSATISSKVCQVQVEGEEISVVICLRKGWLH